MAAGVAWLIATEVLGHSQPFFAPVSAIITLGLTVGQRGRRAVELALGVALGIAVADLLVLADRHRARRSWRSSWCSRRRAAIFLGSGQLLATPGRRLGRAGGHAAAADRRHHVHALPRRAGRRRRRRCSSTRSCSRRIRVGMVRRAARPLLEELAATLEDIAAAIERARPRRSPSAALERARGIDELERAASTRRSSVGPRDDPLRAAAPRRSRGWSSPTPTRPARIDLAVRNVRVLARGDDPRRSGSTRTCRPRSPTRCATSPRPCGRSAAALDDPDRAADVRERRAARRRRGLAGARGAPATCRSA